MSEVKTETNPARPPRVEAGIDHVPDGGSAASWAAILAGAAGAVALSLVLLILGTGLGFSAVSPWALDGIDTTTFGFAAILWVTFTQLAASGMGGYLAGRLRSRWTAVHNDEVYFRDTAHGFLAWAVSSLLMVVVLAAAMGSVLSPGGSASDEGSDATEYFVDSLFRSDPERSTLGLTQPSGDASDIPADEVMRIFARALQTGTLPQEDERYLAQLVEQHTGLDQQDAERRVSEGFGEAQTTLEDTRSASAFAALWMFVALLVGAFTASLMAVFGGRQRDTQ